MAKILNFGSLNIDKTYRVDRIVRPGETISSYEYEEFIGGKGLNQSIAIKNAGCDIYHAGMVGIDDGDFLVEYLEGSGVDTRYISSVNGPSGHAIIQIDNSANNSIIVCGASNRMIDKDYIDYVLDNFSSGDFLILQNEISNIPYIVDKAYDKGMVIFFNPSPMDSLISEVDLSKINYFLINEEEGKGIAGDICDEDILDSLIFKYSNSKFVLTLGSRGVSYKDRDYSYHIDGEEVDVVDTTGAGDTFTGYFIAHIFKGKSIYDSLNIANKAASIACKTKGASNSIPRLEDIL